MTDLEIDRALALAIGWNKHYTLLRHLEKRVIVWVGPTEEFTDGWRVFSHKDWNVIGPIAARYNAFPMEDCLGQWFASIGIHGRNVTADKPQKAIALAVIGAKK